MGILEKMGSNFWYLKDMYTKFQRNSNTKNPTEIKKKKKDVELGLVQYFHWIRLLGNLSD